MSTSKRQGRPPGNSARKHPSGTLRDLRCFLRGPRRGASSARLFRPLESGQRKPRPDEFPQGSGGALSLADRRRLTRAPRLRERPVRRHEPRQHGRNEFRGLESFSRRLAREGLGVGDEIAMQRRRQLDRHLHRLVVFDRAELQLRHHRLFNSGRVRARGHG